MAVRIDIKVVVHGPATLQTATEAALELAKDLSRRTTCRAEAEVVGIERTEAQVGEGLQAHEPAVVKPLDPGVISTAGDESIVRSAGGVTPQPVEPTLAELVEEPKRKTSSQRTKAKK
jgi:hypothetical protein